MTYLIDRLPLHVKRDMFQAEALISATKECDDPRLRELAVGRLEQATTELWKFNRLVTGMMILFGLQAIRTKLISDSGESYDLTKPPFKELE
jgi:hypothetical protein